VCLDALRSRKSRREGTLEEPLGVHVPDPIASRADGIDPEHEAFVADSVGLALLVVLEKLAPTQRLAFVLHDMFAVPFDEIAPIVDRSPAAARQLAGRARRRVQEQAPVPDAGLGRQREVVDAFLAASREADFEALLALLDPDVVLRADAGTAPTERRGRCTVHRPFAELALAFSQVARFSRPALVNGAVGFVTVTSGELFSVMGFTIKGGKIVEIDIRADAARLAPLDLTVLDD
jgi:hypothetical protein